MKGVIIKGIAPNSHVKTIKKVLELVLQENLNGKRILDAGCGEGYFSMRLYKAIEQKKIAAMIYATDIYPELFKFDKIRCDQSNMEHGLPYPDEYFDIVCSIEVIEHIEDQFKFCRELARITKPDGMVIITTPNTLNINSRITYLGYGMFPLFDILSVNNNDKAGGDGHIHPVSPYYLSYMLRKSGFSNIEFFADKIKRSGIALLLFTLPFIWFMKSLYFVRMMKSKPVTLNENRRILEHLNSLAILTSRSIVVKATRFSTLCR